MKIETQRLIITELTMDMAQVVHENSLDEDTRRFVPDEVFETIEDAAETVEYLMSQYEDKNGPLVYPIITKERNENIGYVQLAPLDDDAWEVGYHIGKKYTQNGYATEAVKSFLPVITEMVGISEVYGICIKENIASICVMNKCGFTKLFEGISKYQGEDREIYKAIWKK